jgi:hypothetical protein
LAGWPRLVASSSGAGRLEARLAQRREHARGQLLGVRVDRAGARLGPHQAAGLERQHAGALLLGQ